MTPPAPWVNRHVVYRCFDAAGLCLYVGQTRDLTGRMTTHRATPWAHRVDRVKITVHSGPLEARRVEREEIRRLSPAWNIKSRVLRTRDDYRTLIAAIAVRESTSYNMARLRRLRATLAAIDEASA